MSAPARPRLEPGRVYRTRDLARWSANPTRLASRLVRDGELVRLRSGLFAAPRRGRFGPVPPSDEALLDAFLGGAPFLLSGSPRWNALGLGATAIQAVTLVYNTRRTGLFELGGRRFFLRRVRFPEQPSPEFFVVDLLSNASGAGLSEETLVQNLSRAVAAGRFDRTRLLEMALAYGGKSVQDRIHEAIGS